MPQPIRFPERHTFRGGDNVLLQRPALAAQMGNIVANWVVVEDQLMSFYELLMGAYIDIKPGFAPPTHPVARQVFSVLESFNAKLSLVDELCKWVASDQAPAFAEFRDTIRSVGRGRHLVAHGLWYVCDAHPDDLILRTTDRWVRYTLMDFETINRRILDCRQELSQITMQYYGYRQERARWAFGDSQTQQKL